YRIELVRRDTSQSPAVCGVADTYNNAQQPLKIWLNRQQLFNAVAPQIHSVSLPNAKPMSTNVNLDFSAGGTATFVLQSSDVGLFSLEVEDDTRIFSNNSDISGSSNVLTVRPFAIDVDFIMNGIADRQAQGLSATSFAQDLTGLADPNASVFATAGAPFVARVSAIQWQAADDLNNDGQADSQANLSDNGVTVNFGQELSSESIFISHSLAAPVSGSVGSLGGNLFSSFSNGARSQAMTWSEVGIMHLSARLLDNDYLASGVSVRGEARNVGRFIPHSFIVRDHALISDPVITEACELGVFTYLEQNFTLNYELLASNLAGDVTENYTGDFIKLDNSLGSLSIGAADIVIPQNLSALLPNTSDINNSTSYLWGPAMGISLGVVEIETVLTIDRLATADGPFTASIGALPVDADGVSIERLDLDIDNDTVNDFALLDVSQQRYGRVFLENAFGPETRPLTINFNAQYFNQAIGAAGRFILNRDDSCSSYLASDFSFVIGSYTQRLNSGETSINAITSSPYTLGAGGVILTAPGNNNEGSVDVHFRVENFLRFDWDSDVTTADTAPVNTANFGSYRGNDRIIYRREVSQ
ncbi:MAG: DUF6701 domain-containing protein, partial [Pseudomonadales bacterium]